MRSHLNLRTSEQDEQNILLLTTRWQIDRSDAARKALALAASMLKEQQIGSKKELLEHSQFIGSEKASEFTSCNYKKNLKKSLKKKYAH